MRLRMYTPVMGADSTGHRKRCKRYDEPGHAHYLTFSCFQRRPFLRGRLAPQWVLDAIDAARQARPFDLWAYVIMPEHVHLLLLPQEGVRISAILKEVKQPVSVMAVQYVKANAPGFLSQMRAYQQQATANLPESAGVPAIALRCPEEMRRYQQHRARP